MPPSPEQLPKKTLIIENDAQISEMIRQILNDLGINKDEIDATYSPKSTKQILEQSRLNQKNYDLVLLDLNIGGVAGSYDGITCLRGLKDPANYGNNPSLCPRVVVVTAENDPNLLGEAKSCGADEILKKPFLIEDLEKAIRTPIIHE